MNLCNETITVFNAKYDSVTGKDVYNPTVITGVSWYCEIAANVDAKGLKAADKVTIRVPVDADFGGKTYLEPKAYALSGSADKNFTFQNGDIIVKGAVSGSGLRPHDLTSAYDYVITILGVTDNRRAPNAKHWKVIGS